VRALPAALDAAIAACPTPPRAFIETQPMHMVRFQGGKASSVSNTKTKCLQHVLQVLLLQRGVAVSFVSPSLKLRGQRKQKQGGQATAQYKDNKEYAIVRAHELAAGGPRYAWFAALTKLQGRADAADALVQAYEAALDALGAQDKARKRLAREAASVSASVKPKTKKPKRSSAAVATDTSLALERYAQETEAMFK